jgi:signal transduction histidine kinase
MKKSPTSLRIDSRPWWLAPLVGYILALALIVVAILIAWLETFVDIHDYMTGVFFVIGTLLIGWFWGTHPAFLALVVGILCIDYLVIPPIHTFTFFLWPDIVSLLPFIILQLLILWLIRQQKTNQSQLLSRQQEIVQYAEQLAEMNAQLEQANRFKDQFLSQASHELKTPLTTIRGQTQLALRRLFRQSPLPADFVFLPAHLEKVEAQTRRLHTLVDDLLRLSSLRSGKMPLRVEPCDFNPLCRDIIGDLSSLEERQIDLTLPSDPIMLQADEGRLSQVIINLVTNALKYSPVLSVVHVEVRQMSTQIMLTVQNEGPVISPEQQKSIFEPFYRTPEVQTSASPGWGLGLAISKEIVEQHEGHIWVESSEEKGTTFFVALPLSTGIAQKSTESQF